MNKSLIIDTGTWLKLEKLLKSKTISYSFIDSLYNNFKIIITPEIELELRHFEVTSWRREKTYIIPVENVEPKKKAISDGFDEADASIFGIKDNKIAIILSEDRPLIRYGRLWDLNFRFFAEFLLVLGKNSLISRKQIHFLNKKLYSIRNISKKLHQYIKDNIQK